MQPNKTAPSLLSKVFLTRRTSRGSKAALLCAVLLLLLPAAEAAAKSSRQQVIQIVIKIQRADYEGDRGALPRLYDELTPFVADQAMRSRVLYWRGFALWRRALNGANESVNANDLDSDLKQAVSEFREALLADPKFTDAKIAAASCLFFRMFLNRGDSERVKVILPEALQLMKGAQAADPDNPRFLWVQGGTFWYLPAERGGGEAKALEAYQQGLASARKQRVSDPLDPAWGEPELLMNLSWSSLHSTTPNLEAAQQYANDALKIIPYWHYVRDILLVQIQAGSQKR